MASVQLLSLAHARSGDKGSHANIGLIAKQPEYYEILEREVTAERVADHFRELCDGEVSRYELPNLNSFNFFLREALDGGGTVTLRIDAQGKTYSAALLRMMIDVSDAELALIRS
ncbi:MAG: hypothetical protein DRQ60_00575 [Gammaproteobacteria bacterium]|nr:MAG: hypothetical protein DRQ52_08775 [Gammaproteobacteria bacterium]RLA18034.1 MAG: hypothetical protein DRQ60_00575 [Gammaproteobacteria bacterium]